MSAPPIKSLVQASLAIHNFNKAAEQRLGLSLVQYHVVSALLELPGCSHLDLAEATGVHPSTLTQTLKILERKGLVFVDQHPKDSRKRILIATREGKASHASFSESIDGVLKSLNPTYLEWMRSLTLPVERRVPPPR